MRPPVLVSRMLTFVLAGAIVVLATLCFTLLKMIPLERPEVFFLFTPTRSSDIIILPMAPDDMTERTLYWYKRGFIYEYILARNTLYSGNQSYLTRKNWSNVVKTWSSDKVFEKFTKTAMYKDYLFNTMTKSISCEVNFENTSDKEIRELRDGWYQVNFVWVCRDENIGRQTISKNYKIQLRIESEVQSKLSGTLENVEKLRQNPLGIRVVDYVIKDGGMDPLDSDIKSL